jgi:V8-like Glu-specific endopeptidase/endonuclease/exonuclease/phosphatase family metal-dependent hydrolase
MEKSDLSVKQDFLSKLEVSKPTDLSSKKSYKNLLEGSQLGFRTQETGLRMRAMEQVSVGRITKEMFDDLVSEEDPKKQNEIILETIISRSNLLPSYFLNVGADRAKAICKIEASGINYKKVSGSWVGTGFLVSKNILLTNHHVINSQAVANQSIAIFNFEKEPDGGFKKTKNFHCNPARLFISSPENEFDYTFVWLDGNPGEEFGWIKLDRTGFRIIENEFANIIQHPGGEPKAIAIQENKINNHNQVFMHYTSDTTGGSSGAAVLNNDWQLIGLHHASRQRNNTVENEGIKITAIAAHLEKLSMDPENRYSANEVLRHFEGSDSMMGFFGALGRYRRTSENSYELLVDAYKGEERDIDVGFWNIEWFNKYYETKMKEVAKVITSMNLDIWALEEVSPKSTKELVDYLNRNFNLEYTYAASEPDASDYKQSTTVIWNTRTVKGKVEKWPKKINDWFKVHSLDFDDLVLEAVEGKVFNRYPGLFYFEAKNRSDFDPFNFYLIPLHLKAKGEGSKRRIMASKVLGAAINKMIEEYNKDQDFIIGGDYNATLASEDFDDLIDKGFVAVSAADEKSGAFSYIKSRYKSLIDHIFLSPNLAYSYGSDDYFIVARDRTLPNFIENVSDHRPVLIRLSLNDHSVDDRIPATPASITELKEILKQHSP